jgi:hypothetical protein
MKHLYTVEVPALSGKKSIAKSKIFSWIDKDFVNWGADKIGVKSKKQKLDVLEIEKDRTFRDFFSEEQVLTQEQILYFIENCKDKLRDDGYTTFFLFKSGKDFFVARVHVYSGGLDVYVFRFEDSRVWFADDRRRVVVPQLDTKSLKSTDILALELFDPLEIEFTYKGEKYGIINR